MKGTICILLIGILATGCWGAASDDWDVIWHPKYRMAPNLAHDDNPYSTPAQWDIAKEGICSATTSTTVFNAPEGAACEWYRWANSPPRPDSQWTRPIAFFVRNKTSGELYPNQYVPGQYNNNLLLYSINGHVEISMVRPDGGNFSDNYTMLMHNSMNQKDFLNGAELVFQAKFFGHEWWHYQTHIIRVITNSYDFWYPHGVRRKGIETYKGKYYPSESGKPSQMYYYARSWPMGTVNGVHWSQSVSFRGHPGPRKLVYKFRPKPLVNESDYIEFETPVFNITSSDNIVHDIEVVGTRPQVVTAGNPFKITFQQVSTQNQSLVVSNGWTSKNYVYASIHMTHKLWHTDREFDQPVVYSSENHISGPDAVFKKNTMEMVVWKQMTNGKAEIEFALDDVMDKVHVNFTVIQRGFPYRPSSNYYSYQYSKYMADKPRGWWGNTSVDTGYQGRGTAHKDSITYETIDNKQYVRLTLPTTEKTVYDSENLAGSINLDFKVLPQTGTQLKFVQNSPASSQDASRAITGIQVELVDANGYRVKSGDDASLVITVTASSGTLSNDANFKLVRGVGTFTGSIIDAATGVKLTFKTGSLAGIESNAFDVVAGKFKIASVGASANEVKWIEQALTKFDSSSQFELTHRSSDIADYYDTINNDNKIVGAAIGDKSVINPIAGITINGEAVAVDFKSDRRDFTVELNVNRVKPSTSSSDYIISKFFKTRYWDSSEVVVLVDNGDDASFLKVKKMLGEHSVRTKKIAYPSNTDDTSLTAYYKSIKSTGQVIVCMATGSTLKSILDGAVTDKFTGADGFQWIGFETFAEDFPYSSADLVTKFNTSLVFQVDDPHLIHADWAAAETATATSASTSQEKQYFAAAYDSIDLLIKAIKKVIADKNTLSYASLNAAMGTYTSKDSNYKGILGALAFAEGDRLNAKVKLSNIGSSKPVLKRYLTLSKSVPTAVQGLSLSSKILWRELALDEEHVADLKYALDKNFVAGIGMMNEITVNLVKSGTLTPTKENSIPSELSCEGGCGGDRLGGNAVAWSNGKCVQGKCQCNTHEESEKPGYSGKSCGTIECRQIHECKQGDCTSPGVCTCKKGYKHNKYTEYDVKDENGVLFNRTTENLDCSIPMCDTLPLGCPNEFGECIAPGTCKCNSGRYGASCQNKCPDCGTNGKCSDGAGGNGKCICETGFTGDNCETSVALIAVPAVLGSILVVVAMFFFVKCFLKDQALKAALYNMDWQVNWDDIRLRQKQNRSSMKSMVSMVSMMTSRMSRMSGKSGKEDKIVCQNQGSWNGKEIVIKTLNKDTIHLTDQIRREIMEMKDINHVNLCAFIGAVVQSPNIAVLNEICAKGSLEDVLFNNDTEIDWSFKFSMLKDVCRGMSFLHSTSIGSHGRLKTSNCLVDSKWCVKISDYGMRQFKANQNGVRAFQPPYVGVELPTEEELEFCDYYSLLWTAPEILSTGVSHPNHVGYGTQEGDVYSLAVIMSEICNHNHPFFELDHLGPEEIVPMLGGLIPLDANLEKTLFNNGTIESIRPYVEPDKYPDSKAEEFIALQQSCWDATPSNRPSFKEIMKVLNQISPHRGELMDNLINLMTHYTNTLESIISERTNDLKAEKDAGDALLSKMLPDIIAFELKAGRNPAPEYFGCVTIQFSDVVGFGKICNESTPIEVVDLLNALYDTMDDVIDQFDCYKVETIADSYVVASGIPNRNGDKHAGVIATQALTLLSAINDVSYKHMPGSQVQLRIGINSGPIVGGVVGLRMPRYCLFGDTMNTASRMESGGYALKIHISESCYNLLEAEGGYQTISRGEREIKGKGIMKTFWLVGRDDMKFNLPSEDKAASLSLHHFK